MCRCTARNFGPISEKFADLERFKPGFPAIIGNFAVEIAHIREALSSEQFCVVRVVGKQLVVMPGLVPGIHVLRAACKAWMAGSSPAMTTLRRLRFANARQNASTR